jgi:deoxycytidylate deaminase
MIFDIARNNMTIANIYLLSNEQLHGDMNAILFCSANERHSDHNILYLTSTQ